MHHQQYIFTLKRKKLTDKLESKFGSVPLRSYDSYIFSSISSFWNNAQLNEKRMFQVDDLTWNDLDMDDVFKQINNTCSSVGEEYLYASLRNQSYNKTKLNRLEETVDFLGKHKDIRVITPGKPGA